jgi:hypothetical protein
VLDPHRRSEPAVRQSAIAQFLHTGGNDRVSAYLTDGTHLPCVSFQVAGAAVKGSTVAAADIGRLEASPFAWPAELLRQIETNTFRNWSVFVVEMRDGRRFSYRTPNGSPFLDLPEGCSHTDVSAIHNHMVHKADRGTLTYEQHFWDDTEVNYLGARPYFTCILDDAIHCLFHVS